MKKFLLGAALLGFGLACHSAQAACRYPIAPGKFPDGNIATREEIKAARDTVFKYDADMKEYLACIQAEYQAKVAANADATADEKADWERKHGQKEDAALQEVKDVVDRFNEQLNAWKARNGLDKKSS